MLRQRPQHQRVIAVDSRAETPTRLDLSDLCFVDDLSSLLIFWRKSQLSRFAQMVSQVLESGSLRVIKSKLEVLVGAAGPGARRINAEVARGACQFTFRGETIRAIAVVKCLGCHLESPGNTHAEAQTKVNKASQAETRFSRGLWAPRAIGLSTKIRLWQTLVRSAHACQPRGVETLEKCQKRSLRHIARAPAGAHARPSKEAWSAHGHVHAARSEVALGEDTAS